MFLRKPMRVFLGKARRSDLYFLLIAKLPVKRVSEVETGYDLLGGVMVVSLLAGLVVFMRYLLAN